MPTSNEAGSQQGPKPKVRITTYTAPSAPPTRTVYPRGTSPANPGTGSSAPVVTTPSAPSVAPAAPSSALASHAATVLSAHAVQVQAAQRADRQRVQKAKQGLKKARNALTKVSKQKPTKVQKGPSVGQLQRAFTQGKTLLPGLDPQQTKVAAKILKTGIKSGATRKELVSSVETGLVESGLRNLKHGDAASLGWRQEQTTFYPVSHATSVKKSAQDYFSETANAGRGVGQSAGTLAQSVQRSAYPARYDQVAAQARPVVKAFTKGLKQPTGPYVSPFTKASFTQSRTDEGVDYTGQGQIGAIGKARYLGQGQGPGWASGGGGGSGYGVVYHLLKGPHKGQNVFLYEGIAAAGKSLSPGDTIKKGQTIASFVPGGSIEMGLSDKSGAPLAQSTYSEGDVTSQGVQFQKILSKLGAASKPGAAGISGTGAVPVSGSSTPGAVSLGRIPATSVPAGTPVYSPTGKLLGTSKQTSPAAKAAAKALARRRAQALAQALKAVGQYRSKLKPVKAAQVYRPTVAQTTPTPINLGL